MTVSVPISHVEYQAQIVDLSHILGWSHLHVRRTVGRGRKWVTATNVIGWPDLWLWHPAHGFAAIEVKVGKDRPSPEQEAVLASLAAAGARTMVAYPAEFDAVTRLLRGFPPTK